MDNDDMMVTITLSMLEARKLLHLYGWACDQSEASARWWDIYQKAMRQVDEQTRVQ